ncbi:transketolase [Candidatus Wolfebacteria bacterium]|nr:transketolase [Candidatus Wolfebacteria bacterium]
MENLREEKIKFLEEVANQLRRDVIEMLAESGTGHPAGALGMAEIFSAFYFHILKHNPKKPDWPERDRLVLSNGHTCPILYAAMSRAGYFPIEELKTFRKINSRLQGHPSRKALPGIETSSGPLGEGLSQAIGMALCARTSNLRSKYRTYCIMSDAEQNCGNIWEAAMFAGNKRLSNLTAIIDRNNIQSDGTTEEIMPLEPLKEKYESFNWEVLEIDGHNVESFIDAVSEAQAIYEKPTIIIARTIAGKGVDFMEADYKWHGTAPTKEQAKEALKELKKEKSSII